jgi:hemerythrin-like metal-binding protein
MITWDKSYATGDDTIDRHHQLLFTFFNDLEDQINKGKGKDYVARSLNFFEHYIECHFGIEEFCMHKHKCPFAEKNKQAHAAFKKAFAGYKNRIDEAGYSDEIATDMHRFLEDWITGHIIHIDGHLNDVIHG